MQYRNIDNINIENARIIFRNFSGREDKYNRAGVRTFGVVIDNDLTVSQLTNDGWNVKMTILKNKPTYYIPVEAGFERMPPKVFLISGRQKTQLDEESIAELDYADIKNIDLTLRPYQWEVQEKSGVKAYLKTMYVTIEEDALANKYKDEIIAQRYEKNPH